MQRVIAVLTRNRITNVLVILSLLMVGAVAQTMASLRVTSSQSTYCGKPCSLSSQCGGSCPICSTGTCHY